MGTLYTGVPTVGPSNVTQDYQQVRVGPDAFGAAMGEALQRGGAQLREAGDSLLSIAQRHAAMTADTTVRDAVVKAQIDGGQLSADYHAREGLDAVNSFTAHQQSIYDLINKQAAQFKGQPVLEKMFRDQMARQTGIWLNSAATWSATQNRAAAKDSIQAQIALEQNNSGVDAADDKAFGTHLQNIGAAVQHAKEVYGWDDTKAKEYGLEQQTMAWKMRYQALAQTDPEAAKTLFDKNKGAMTAGAQIEVERLISTQMDAKTSRKITDDVMAGANSGDSTDNYMRATRIAESGGNPNAVSHDPTTGKPIAYGLYQATPGTWRAVGEKHPELGLTGDNILDPQKQELFMRALTADNAAGLKLRGLDASPANLRMAHFLGVAGASTFLKAMRSDPNQAADGVVGEKAARGNPSVFYNKDGSPKTLAQVFAQQTAKFGGNMSAPSLADLQAEGQARAKAIAPDDPVLSDNVTSHIETAYNQQQATARDTQNQAYQNVFDAATGNGNYQGQPHSLAQIQTDPALMAAWMQLPGEKQEQIKTEIQKQFSQDDKRVPDAQEVAQVNYYRALQVAHPEEMAKVPYKDFQGLPKQQRDEVLAMQRAAIAKAETPPKPKGPVRPSPPPSVPEKLTDFITRSIMPDTALRDIFGENERGTGVDTKNPRYLQYQGALTDWIQTFIETHDGARPSDDQMKQEAGQLLRQAVAPTKGGYKLDGLNLHYEESTPGSPFGFETYKKTYVPANLAAKFTQQLIAQGVKSPTPMDVRKMYEKLLSVGTTFSQPEAQ